MGLVVVFEVVGDFFPLLLLFLGGEWFGWSVCVGVGIVVG